MTRSRLVALTLITVAGVAHVAYADVRSDEKTKFQLAGVLGKVATMFGGKAAREGVDSTVMVKGDRKVMTSGSTSEIVDLAEEKVYTIDLKRKTYTVVTFADMRRQMDEARRKAEEEARKADAGARPDTSDNAGQRQYEFDFDVKNTGETRTINGFNTRQAIMTVAVREKGKTLDQSGGLVLTTEFWLAPRVPEMNELVDFDMRYAQKLYGPMLAGASPQDMAAAMAMYPQMKPALERMATEGKKLEGTPILTVMTAEGVKSADQLAQEQQAEPDTKLSNPRSVGGVLGGLARKATTKKEEPKARATIMTASTEVLRIATTVAAADVALPAGLKETK